MAVCMHRVVFVGVEVGVRLVSDGAVDAPYAVGEAEGDQGLCGKISAPCLEEFKPAERNAERRSEQSKRDRSGHMANAAQEGDPQGFGQRPVARLAHHDERQVMVGAAQRMTEADQGGGSGKYGDGFVHDVAT